jgi:predicted fused transcriptional regulator/phosphomethylpyrimidine kinase
MITAGRPEWRTSSYSNAGESCIEVAAVPGRVLVRDTKHRAGGMIEFNRPVWTAFVVATGER